MKRIIWAVVIIGAVSGIIIAQNTTNAANARDRQDRQINLQSQTRVAAQLQGGLDARHARAGDRVILKTTEAVKQDGRVIIPKGAQLIGRVTQVQQHTKENGESQITLLFDQIRSGSLELPITASILSITQGRANTQAENSTVDTDLTGQSSASTRASAPPRNNNSGGLLGGVGNTVGGVVNTTTSTAGTVAGTTTNAVGSTVGATTNTAGSLTGSLRDIQITQSAGASAQGGSTLSLTGNNLRLESGTTFNLAISSSAAAGNP